MKVVFPYKKEDSELFGEVYRPIAVVYFIGKREILEIPYVDSGADITLVPRTVGELLGFEMDAKNVKPPATKVAGVPHSSLAHIHLRLESRSVSRRM